MGGTGSSSARPTATRPAACNAGNASEPPHRARARAGRACTDWPAQRGAQEVTYGGTESAYEQQHRHQDAHHRHRHHEQRLQGPARQQRAEPQRARERDEQRREEGDPAQCLGEHVQRERRRGAGERQAAHRHEAEVHRPRPEPGGQHVVGRARRELRGKEPERGQPLDHRALPRTGRSDPGQTGRRAGGEQPAGLGGGQLGEALGEHGPVPHREHGDERERQQTQDLAQGGERESGGGRGCGFAGSRGFCSKRRGFLTEGQVFHTAPTWGCGRAYGR